MRAPRDLVASSRSRIRAFFACFAALFVVCASAARATAAEVTLNGSWKQSALREEFKTSEWQASCGPAPSTQSSGGGETIQVRREGDELSFIGGGRVYRTNQCYETLPNLARDAHSRDATGRNFRTHCATPANDPRQADLQTVISATDDRIELVETGRYASTVAEGKCAATVRRSRTYTLIAREGDGEPAATATATATATAAVPVPVAEKPAREPSRANCTEPGEAERLEVHPRKKVLKPGEKFVFSARISDSKGCTVKGEVAWSTKDSDIAVDARGNVSVASEAKEGTREIRITAGERSTTVTVEVSSPENYEALLKQQGLDSNGDLDDMATVMLSGSASDHGTATSEDGSKRRRTLFLALLGFAVATLAGIVWWLRHRLAKTRANEARAGEQHAVQVAAAAELERNQRATYEAQLRAHEASVAAKAQADAVYREKLRAVERAREALVRKCPECQREFQAPTSFCPHDGCALLSPAAATGRLPKPANAAVADTNALGTAATIGAGANVAAPAAPATAAPIAKPMKLCPKCGDHFDTEATFCGKDGGALVPINN